MSEAVERFLRFPLNWSQVEAQSGFWNPSGFIILQNQLHFFGFVSRSRSFGPNGPAKKKKKLNPKRALLF